MLVLAANVILRRFGRSAWRANQNDAALLHRLCPNVILAFVRLGRQMHLPLLLVLFHLYPHPSAAF